MRVRTPALLALGLLAMAAPHAGHAFSTEPWDVAPFGAPTGMTARDHAKIGAVRAWGLASRGRGDQGPASEGGPVSARTTAGGGCAVDVGSVVAPGFRGGAGLGGIVNHVDVGNVTVVCGR